MVTGGGGGRTARRAPRRPLCHAPPTPPPTPPLAPNITMTLPLVSLVLPPFRRARCFSTAQYEPREGKGTGKERGRSSPGCEEPVLELALSPREKPGVTRGCPGVRRVPTELVDSSFRKSREGDRKCRSSRKGAGAPTRSLVTRASAGAAGALAVLSGGQTVEPPPTSRRVSRCMRGSGSERAEALFVRGLSCLV